LIVERDLVVLKRFLDTFKFWNSSRRKQIDSTQLGKLLDSKLELFVSGTRKVLGRGDICVSFGNKYSSQQAGLVLIHNRND
jgi:hypothetical protein